MGSYCPFHLVRGLNAAFMDSSECLVTLTGKGERCKLCGRQAKYSVSFYPKSMNVNFVPLAQSNTIYGTIWSGQGGTMISGDRNPGGEAK